MTMIYLWPIFLFSFFQGLLFTSHWLNLQHWTCIYIAVYGNFQGLSFAFRGQNRPEPRVIFFLICLAFFIRRQNSNSIIQRVWQSCLEEQSFQMLKRRGLAQTTHVQTFPRTAVVKLFSLSVKTQSKACLCKECGLLAEGKTRPSYAPLPRLIRIWEV